MEGSESGQMGVNEARLKPKVKHDVVGTLTEKDGRRSLDDPTAKWDFHSSLTFQKGHLVLRQDLFHDGLRLLIGEASGAEWRFHGFAQPHRYGLSNNHQEGSGPGGLGSLKAGVQINHGKTGPATKPKVNILIESLS
jgi:hypothetical protein